METISSLYQIPAPGDLGEEACIRIRRTQKQPRALNSKP